MVYRDGASAKETSKLCHISLHLLYTSLVSVYVNFSHRTPMLFFGAFNCYHEYSFTIITLCITMNINLCCIEYSWSSNNN